MVRVLLRSGALSEFGVLSLDRSALLTEMSINFAILTGPVGEIIIASLSHMSATPRSKSTPYSLLTLLGPTSSIDLCGEL